MGNVCCTTPGNEDKEKTFLNIAKISTHDDKYRKSSNTPFFTRQNNNLSKYNYYIDPETVEVKDNKEFRAVLCDLYDAKNKEKQLQLIIARVIGDVLRISVKEHNNEKNKKQRYEVNDNDDVLSSAARVPLPFANVESTESDTILSWNTYRIKIFYQPFTAYIYESDELQILINNGNKFYFEAYSNKAQKDSALHHEYHHDHGYCSIGLDFDFVQANGGNGAEEEVNLYGLPSHSTSFSLPSTNTFEFNNEAYRMYNLDVYKYRLNSPASLYGSIPYIIHHNAASTNSILWCNASETFATIYPHSVDEYTKSKNVRFLSETGALETFILLHKNSVRQSYLSQYYALTGRPQLPPLFAVAHHQCRWNYVNEQDVMEIDAKFDEYQVPNDVIWLDIEHTDKKKYFTWDPQAFPDPDRLINHLSDGERQRKVVCIIDPHIKNDEEYSVFREIEKKDYWVKTREGQKYFGDCWPGISLYPDYINPAMRRLWSGFFKELDPNIFVWNDMNEPAVFNTCEGTMPISNKHNDGIHFDLRHKEIHNLYGYYFHKASFEGLLARNHSQGLKQRPFLLSRSFFIGSQKYGAIWTGDNKSNWKHLAASVAMLLSLSVAGIPFVGADVGGFFGNCNAKLMQRWYNLAVFYPFFRNHSNRNSRRQEFWMFDDCDEINENDAFRDKKCMLSMIDSIRERYRLLPYIYSLFYLSHAEGHPIMRPLWYEFPHDVRAFHREDAFMFGDALFVAPIVTEDAHEITVKLPQAQPIPAVFYEVRRRENEFKVNVYRSEEKEEGEIRLVDYKFSTPVLRLGGKITVEKHQYLRASSALMKHDPITIIVAADSNNCAQSRYYADDGETLNHAESDEYLLCEFTFDGAVFKNKIIHSADAVDICEIYQIWILMPQENQIKTQKKVTVKTKQLKGAKEIEQVYYKTPHLLIIDDVDVAVNFDFEIQIAQT